MYLGIEPFPSSVPGAPDAAALVVASLTWRRGLRSEFLWTAYDNDLCVLWERLPGLQQCDGQPWIELFAWTRGRAVDPARSAQRLLQRGWAETNPAYDWLAAPNLATSLGLRKAFAVTSGGIVNEHQVEWLFRAAARARGQAATRLLKSEDANRPLADIALNIGPYPFATVVSNPKKVKPQDKRVASVEAVPLKNIVEANVLTLRRNRKQLMKDSNGEGE